MMLVFMLEEPSMKAFLQGLLPRILPPHVGFKLIPHEGKSDLEKSLKIKLRGWRTPETRFIVGPRSRQWRLQTDQNPPPGPVRGG